MRVCERIFRLDDILKLRPQPSALVHVSLKLDFELLQLGALEVALESVDFGIAELQLRVELLDSPFKVQNEVGFGFEAAEFGHTGVGLVFAWNSEVLASSLVLGQYVVDNFVSFEELALDDLKLRLQLQVILRQSVRCDARLHDVVVETLALLMHDSGPQFADFKLELTGRFVGKRGLLHVRVRILVNAEFLAEGNLGLAAGSARPTPRCVLSPVTADSLAVL